MEDSYRDSKYTGAHIYNVDLFEDKDNPSLMENLFWEKLPFPKDFFRRDNHEPDQPKTWHIIFSHLSSLIIHAAPTWMCALLSLDAWRVSETWSSPYQAGPKVRTPFLSLSSYSLSQPAHLHHRPDRQHCFQWICGLPLLLPGTWGKSEIRWKIYGGCGDENLLNYWMHDRCTLSHFCSRQQ